MPKIKVPYTHPTFSLQNPIGLSSLIIIVFLVYSSIIGLTIWGIVKLIKYIIKKANKKKEKFNQHRFSSKFPKRTAFQARKA